MYTALLHTHKLSVVLFLLIYLVKGILLLINSPAQERVKKILKVPEMILSFLFLATGIGMLAQIAEVKTLLIIKIVVVFASIPLAVIGFKKGKKALAVLSILLLITAYGLAEMSKRKIEKKDVDTSISDVSATSYDAVLHGKALFEANCVACHGADGKLMLSGAKDLTLSQSTDEQISQTIQNGKNAMPAYKKVFDEKEVNALTQYVKTFRKNP